MAGPLVAVQITIIMVTVNRWPRSRRVRTVPSRSAGVGGRRFETGRTGRRTAFQSEPVLSAGQSAAYGAGYGW